MWDILKQKIHQAKEMIEQFKNTNSSKDNIFSKMSSSLNKIKPQLNGVSGLTIKIKNQIKQWSSGFKGSINQVLKYAAALFSLRSIYSILSNSANSWLSSQNKQAQQLSANIDYMKYALGSVFAGVIQYVTNLVYSLMKAIQSLVYAFSGINIFAKATASSMKNTAGSAKDTNKSLAGVHNEINNVSDNKNSGGSGGSVSPSVDLSKVSNVKSDILSAIESGDWYQVGSLIGEKLNDAMNSIQWDKIHNTARKIGKGIADSLNGFIETVNWKQVGNTIAQGLNTAIYLAYEFVTNFKWDKFGTSIGTAVNGFFKNVKWETAGKTLGEGVKGILTSITSFLQEVEWQEIARSVEEFIGGIEWSGVIQALFTAIGSALGGLAELIGTLIYDALFHIGEYFTGKTEECGGNIVLGILKGILDAFLGIGEWIRENITQPFIKAFCETFGIHSPSTVMAELGVFIIQGLLNGITSLVEKIKEIWENIKETAITIFETVKNKIAEIFENIKAKATEVWTSIKTTVTEKINNIKTNVSNALNNIKTSWTNIFNSIKTFTINTFNNIWSTIKGIINSIIGGIEGMANGVTGGVNKVIDSLNGLSFDIPDWVPFFGGKKWSMSIPSIKTVTLPRLKTGSVLYEETAFIGGEYSGARNNPEIVSPVNLIYETQKRAIEDSDRSSNSGDMYFTIKVGNNTIGTICIDELRRVKRQTGKDIEVICDG